MYWALLIIFIIGLDQAAKLIIFADRIKFENLEIIKGFFYITYCENRGAAFGIMQNFRWVLILLPLAAVVFIIMVMIKQKHLLLRISLALILAGGVGNLIDRAFRGFVVDFFHFYPFGYDFAIFNIADVSINIGVFFLFIYIFFVYKEPAKVKKSEVSDDTNNIQEDEQVSNQE